MSTRLTREDDRNSPLAKKNAPIKVSTSFFASMLLSKTAKIVASILGVSVLIYFCFVVTIFRVIPVSGVGLVPTINVTAPGGIIPKGEKILAFPFPVDNSALGRLQQAITLQDGAVLRVIAGPTGAIEKQGNQFTVDGVYIPGLKLKTVSSDRFLRNEYLTVCESGGCDPGDNIIVDQKWVAGIVLGSKSKG